MDVGALVGSRYRVESFLGEGGMASVYSAIHTIIHRRVALKVMHADLAQKAEFRLRFQREARAAATVRHDNVIDIFDVIELEDGTPVIVMEHLRGQTLADRLDARGRTSAIDLVPIGVQVCAALAIAHAAGVVHRDLKPANVFLAIDPKSNNEVVKVLDFGLASSTSTRSPGSPRPARCSGPRSSWRQSRSSARPRSTSAPTSGRFYEGVSGNRSTYGETLGQIMKAMGMRRRPPLAMIAPDVPAPFSELVERMLTIEREGRPRSAREVQQQLERLFPAAPLDQTLEQGPLPEWLREKIKNRPR